MQEAAETVAVAVVIRDRFSMYRKCLEALYAHTPVGFRSVVVAGGADPTTREYLLRLASEKKNLRPIFDDRLLSQSESRQLALQDVKERYCVVLENDTIVHEGWLPAMLACMTEERAAAVMPLIFWYRGIHATGCTFETRVEGGATVLHHAIEYQDIRRKRIDYPESHCVLLDREQVPDAAVFDDVEPSDVDLGLTLRERGRTIFFEPRAVVTYAAPPPWELRDVPAIADRWNPEAWKVRNNRFARKWNLTYDASAKHASYRRQQWRLKLLLDHPSRSTVALTNVAFRTSNRIVTLLTRGRTRRAFG